MELTDFLYVPKILHKFKADWKVLGRAWSKMGVPSLVTGF